VEIALLVALGAVVYLVVLNGYLDGAMKVRIDAVLSVLWLTLLGTAFLAFGWKSGVTAIAASFIGAWFLRPIARWTAAFMFAHPPKR
jgi:hypothetical protein